jgi:hypothetical protein
MNQLVRALAVIPVVALLHGGATAAALFSGIGLTMGSFDRMTAPSLVAQIVLGIAAVLAFPIGPVLAHVGFKSPYGDLLFFSNSLIWGIGAFLLIESQRMLRLKAP